MNRDHLHSKHSPWSGEFRDASLERRYRVAAHAIQCEHFRQFSLFGFVAIAGTIVTDYLFAPATPEAETHSLIRILLLIPLALMLISSRRKWHYATMDSIFLGLALVMVIDCIGIVYLFRDDPFLAGLRIPMYFMVANVLILPRAEFRWIMNATAFTCTVTAFWVIPPSAMDTAPAVTFVMAVAVVFGQLAGNWLVKLKRESFFREIKLQAAQEDLLQSNDELQQASDSKTRFLSNVSHELRTPLNAIIGFSDILKMQMFGPLGSRKYNEYVDDISNSGRHLLDLINDLLDLNRLEAGKAEMTPEPVDVCAESHAWIKEVKAAYPSPQYPAILVAPSDAVVLDFDPRALRQIVVNLLGNAMKYAGAEAEVTLSCQMTPAGAEVKVSDNGSGIDADTVEKLMKPFEQIDATTARQAEGWGLGLPLARSLARANNSDLVLHSTRGRGTTATLCVPPAQSTLAKAGKQGASRNVA